VGGGGGGAGQQDRAVARYQQADPERGLQRRKQASQQVQQARVQAGQPIEHSGDKLRHVRSAGHR
jgi:hypothetical protein